MRPTPIGRFADTPSYEELQREVARLRLTDEEREAIERLCEAANDIIYDDRTAGGSHWQEDEAAVAVARGLLERTK
jgi:hypothetical protein